MKKAFVSKMINCVVTKIYASHLKYGSPSPSRMDCRLTQEKINVEDGVFLFHLVAILPRVYLGIAICRPQHHKHGK